MQLLQVRVHNPTKQILLHWMDPNSPKENRSQGITPTISISEINCSSIKGTERQHQQRRRLQ